MWTSFSNNIIFVLFCFSLLEPPLWEIDWFSTQYLLAWIIVVDPFLQQCHFLFFFFFYFFIFLFFCLFVFFFGASFVPKKLVSNPICISMNYCCGPLSPTMSFLFCFVFLFWSLLWEKEISFQLNIYWYELLLWVFFQRCHFLFFSNNVIFSFCFVFCFSFFEPPLCQRDWFPIQ